MFDFWCQGELRACDCRFALGFLLILEVLVWNWSWPGSRWVSFSRRLPQAALVLTICVITFATCKPVVYFFAFVSCVSLLILFLCFYCFVSQLILFASNCPCFNFGVNSADILPFGTPFPFGLLGLATLWLHLLGWTFTFSHCLCEALPSFRVTFLFILLFHYFYYLLLLLLSNLNLVLG